MEEKEKWSNHVFAVAVTGKHSISKREVLRTVANETYRNKALLNNLDHPVAKQNCVSVLYLSMGSREKHINRQISNSKHRRNLVGGHSEELHEKVRYNITVPKAGILNFCSGFRWTAVLESVQRNP